MKHLGLNLWRSVLAGLVVLTLLVLGNNYFTPEQRELDLYKIKKQSTNLKQKKVIVLLVDSLMSRDLEKGLKAKKLPTLAYFITHGQYYQNLVSAFPTMSVTIDSTLLTGQTPDKHRIPGLVWYSSDEGKIINYGTGAKEVLENRVNQTLGDILKLNSSHLSKEVTTIYETLQQQNKTSGSINGFIYRGKTTHQLTIPPWISLSTILESRYTIYGPDFLSLGRLSNPLHNLVELPVDPTKSIGFNDDFAFKTLEYLIKNNKQPDFVFVYLPDLDKTTHKDAENKLEDLKKLDTQIASLFKKYESLEKALEDNIIIVLGDHSQSKVLPLWENPVVDLNHLLREYNPASFSTELTSNNEVVLAVNERMAYIYNLNANNKIQDILMKLMKDDRIDQIAWMEEGWVHVAKSGKTKELIYKPGNDFKDVYNQGWSLNGDYDILDLTVTKNNYIKYGEYPNGLNQIFAALNSHKGDFFIVTAKPGYQLSGEVTPIHPNGGSHGSFHKSDILAPLIIAGTDKRPTHFRVEDLYPYLLDLLNQKE